ncbi:bifunctional aconitate hydratase 2/2-methylisocitrate dehydratase [Bordetella genomosp. 5]|uniref:bifunctional aconitate hydratase 2/2-methylisocitrate dehydratase n=1 Tax=Bordetella genomosp. 5 TaxID=1395608 RepID=UPI001482B65A|nr:bifunctional aconitate hydratase 2/2-methylisocitrate dehydratase [Bordetella genomosp. 5]
MSQFYTDYLAHCADRRALNLPPLALDPSQVKALIESFDSDSELPPGTARALLMNGVRPGLDPGAAVKAKFLKEIAAGERVIREFTPQAAVFALGSMISGHCVDYLVELLPHPEVGDAAALAMSKLVHVYGQFDRITQFADQGVESAKSLLAWWEHESWFFARASLPTEFTLTLFRVAGEVTTDDLSPAGDVSTRVDVPLHARAMLKFGKGTVAPDLHGVTGPMTLLERMRSRGDRLGFCTDIVGTGSSRASATNSLMWHFGEDLPGQPNRRTRAVCIARQFAPIFLNTQRDYGALPIIADVSALEMGQVITIHTQRRTITAMGKADIRFAFGADDTLMEARAGGRINLVLGRKLTERARAFLAKGRDSVVSLPARQAPSAYSQAQKIVGKAVGRMGVGPGDYCEPRMSAIALPDDAGPSTADELSDLGCQRFESDLVLQSFCHTSAYPGPSDLQVQRTLPAHIRNRGGVVLRPGDGIIHSWLNKFLIPDQMGTGADSHTRFPLGLSIPAASNLVAFAAATGYMPLTMPESVLVRFRGTLKPYLTVRDMVHAIPLVARRLGLLDLSKTKRKNVFSGRLIEVEGVEWLSVESAFEICDATAERGALGATVALSEARVIEHVSAGIELIDSMLAAGYGDRGALVGRRRALEQWLKEPTLLRADPGASYAAEIDIDLDEIGEPILCCPNDPDDARLLSDIQQIAVDEVFIGSCMTRANHFSDARTIFEGRHSVPVKFWVAPPTRMAKHELIEDGTLQTLGAAGARLEPPGCSLCMGNQARTAENAVVVSTSTRNYPNRMGNGAQVYLASGRVAALAARSGRLPSMADYLTVFG